MGPSGPGPGHYNSKTPNYAHGYSVGTGNRPDIYNAELGRNPGPGSYNWKNKKNNMWSFGKESRDRKQGVQTPGFYKLPATVPDVPRYLLTYEGCCTKYV